MLIPPHMWMAQNGGKLFGSHRRPFDILSGTWTRSTEGSYLTGAETDGSTPFLAWASENVPRLDYRNSESLYLIEGSRQNLISFSENFASWGNATFVTTNVAAAPDGATTADRVTIPSGNSGKNQIFTSPSPAGLNWCGSIYQRAIDGSTPSVYQNLIGGSSGWCVSGSQSSTTWARFNFDATPYNSFSQIGFFVGDGRDWHLFTGGTTAGNRDEIVWGAQLEQAAFASSYIRSPSSPGSTRAADIVTCPYQNVPEMMRSGRWSFAVAPIFSSAQGITSGTQRCLFSFSEDGNENVSFVVSGGVIRLVVTSGGATKVQSAALTFSKDQKLTAIVDSSGGLTVSGATSGNGTTTGSAWVFPSSSPTLYIGARQGGTLNAFCRYERYVYAA